MVDRELQLQPNERYLLGISGGRDSVALLHWLLERDFRNIVLCHLNHQLRGEESDADSEFVQELGRDLNLEVEIGVANVAAVENRSIETAAREARHSFFAKCAAKFGTNRVLLAHHADDQIETVLMNLFRGAGSRGLGGMNPVSEIEIAGQRLQLLRPLLEIPRSEIPKPPKFREDSSNATDDFLRNRIRRQVIPTIAEATGRDLTAILRTASILTEENEFLESLTQEIFPSLLEGTELRVPELRQQPAALQRRILQFWLQTQNIADCGFTEVESIRQLLDNHETSKVNLPRGKHARRREKRIFID